MKRAPVWVQRFAAIVALTILSWLTVAALIWAGWKLVTQ